MIRGRFFRSVPALSVLLASCAWATFAQGVPRTLSLAVDARDAAGKILHVRESIPHPPGPLTLFYPKWIPGEHGPTGPVLDLVGLKITAGGAPVSWRRDLSEMYEIHCDLPGGQDRAELTFDFVLPADAAGFSSGASSTARLLVLSWNQVVLYPMEASPDSLIVNANLQLPESWKFGGALEVDRQSGNTIDFKPVSLAKLIDSPVLAGMHFRRIELGSAGGAAHYLDIASDGEPTLEMDDQLLEQYRNLVAEANSLFGAHHYNHYDFLLTLSDQVAHFGLEHHQSSDNRVAERSLVDDDLKKMASGLLPHEFVHSWNGKYRRPSGLATGDYSTPMKGDLLWVYEGLTQYLGKVLAARSGLRSPEVYREDLALLAARLDVRPGRQWRPLQDAADEAQLLYGARSDWESYRRGVDFYDESDLIWLEADVMIRRESKGRKSLDDFCRIFHGGKNTGPSVNPYTFEDVVATLNGVAPLDWRAFLTGRLKSLESHAPLGGIESSGWKLVYSDTPTPFEKSEEAARKTFDLRFSIGVQFDLEGGMLDVIPNSPAARAGLAPGMKLIAVGGRKYSKALLLDAIRESVRNTSPLEFLASNGEFYKTYMVDYHLGARYPHLVRIESRPDLLSSIIRPASPARTQRSQRY
ncbi:MAG TPA: M61 family peptidase [Bacteroidota bacterium]|jgi:predicted metalloprotease with PDZ domain